jgi:predicted membrane protein
MLSPNFSPDPKRERVELLILAIGLLVIVGIFAGLLHGRIFPAVLFAFALLAFAGVIFHRRAGHDVYLIFALIALAIGRVVSPVVVFLAYLSGIGVTGGALRLIGMNKLKRDFTQCRTEPTMFIESQPTTHDGFRRQS